MDSFWPTTATDWLGLIIACFSVFGSTFGALGYLLNKYVTKPINDMRADMREMRLSHSEQLNQHETRLTIVERTVFKNED